MRIYCVRCRKKVYVDSVKDVVLKAGRSKVKMRAWQGTCPICKTKVFRFFRKA